MHRRGPSPYTASRTPGFWDTADCPSAHLAKDEGVEDHADELLVGVVAAVLDLRDILRGQVQNGCPLVLEHQQDYHLVRPLAPDVAPHGVRDQGLPASRKKGCFSKST